MRASWILPVSLGAGPALVFSQWLIWFYAPTELTMGPIQKIFYMHLPLAWWGLISFFTVFAASVGYLFTRKPKLDLLAGAAAETGVLFSALALATGSIWARVSWNTWWTWDPRLTTTLVMWFIYCGYLVLRSMDMGRGRRELVCAAVGVVAFLDVPLVFWSARMWRSIHPSVFASKGGGLAPEMQVTVIVSVLVWSLLWLALVGLRYRLAVAQERAEGLAVYTED